MTQKRLVVSGSGFLLHRRMAHARRRLRQDLLAVPVEAAACRPYLGLCLLPALRHCSSVCRPGHGGYP